MYPDRHLTTTQSVYRKLLYKIVIVQIANSTKAKTTYCLTPDSKNKYSEVELNIIFSLTDIIQAHE